MIELSETQANKAARSLFLSSCNYYTQRSWEKLPERRKDKWRNRARKAINDAFSEKEICRCEACGA